MSNTIIQDARTAIANALTTAGVKSYPYAQSSIPTQAGAELELENAEAAIVDQRAVFNEIVFTLRAYQPMTGNEQQAQSYLDATIASIFVALGADRTLGNKFRSIDLQFNGVEFERYTNGAGAAVAVWRVIVTPHPA